MASKIDVTGLSLNELEASEVGKAVIELAFLQSPLNAVHDVETGISMDSQIVFVDNLDVSGQAFTNCTPAEAGGLTMTEKFWTPKLIGARYTHCANDLSALLKLFKKAQRINPDYFDRVASEELGLLMAKISDAMLVSISAKAWLGDTAAAAQPAGNFTASGFTAGLWNQFDGLWKQIWADSAVQTYTITENAGGTYAAQVLSADKGRTILQQLYEVADPRLSGHPEAQYLVTKSIWDNYLTTIEGLQGAGGIIERLENGAISMNYRGIPIKRMDEWDRTIRKYQDDTAAHFRPHRALLTVPANIKIGTLNESDMTTLDSWYEKKDKTNIVDIAYYLDAKHGESYMTAAAY